MQAYDLIMLIVLAATTIFGAIKGFAWQLASLASIVASYFVAYLFRNDVAKMINAQPPWNLFLAMLLLYFGSSLIIWMLFRLVSTSIDKVKLKDFDRQLGAGFGLIKGVALCLLITMFAMTLLGSAQQQRIANSRSGLYISRILANRTNCSNSRRPPLRSRLPPAWGTSSSSLLRNGLMKPKSWLRILRS